MFVPLRDVGNPIQSIPWPYVTHAIITVNILVFIILNTTSVEEGVGTLLYLSFHHGPVELQPGMPYAGPQLPGPLAAVTSAFVHVDFMHLLGNMLFLWVFGDNIEDALGHARFLAFYLVTAVAAAYAQAFFTDPGYILYGASGAVSGVIVAFMMLHPNVRVWILVLMKIPVPVSALWAIGAWVLFQFFNVLVADTDPGVGWWAHVGGIIAGAILLPLLKRPDVRLFDRGPQRPA